MILPPRLCAGCDHWRKEYPERHKDGYLQAMCDEPADIRDKKMKRASDTCSKWRKRTPRPQWGMYDCFG